jgi:hypothetical protein
MHIVQVLRPPDVLPGYRLSTSNIDNLMFLEYYPRGSLHKAIKNVNMATKVSGQQYRFDTRQLCHIFLCSEFSPDRQLVMNKS